MSRRKWYAMAAVAVVAALALGLAFGLGGGQEQSAPLAQGGLPSGGGVDEGIQVHGHWTLEVRDPDGSLVSHHEFDNALTGGRQTLAYILTGDETVGDWTIRLSCPGDQPFRDGNGSPADGYIREPCPGATPLPNEFYNLNVSLNGSEVIVLRGSAQAQAAGNITQVWTSTYNCFNDEPPSQCNCSSDRLSSPYGFASTTLPVAVQLAANQWVTAEVDISFQ